MSLKSISDRPIGTRNITTFDPSKNSLYVDSIVMYDSLPNRKYKLSVSVAQLDKSVLVVTTQEKHLNISEFWFIFKKLEELKSNNLPQNHTNMEQIRKELKYNFPEIFKNS